MAMMEDRCERCGKVLGPEAFLSKWPVCGKCTRIRHAEAVGRQLPRLAPKRKSKMKMEENPATDILLVFTILGVLGLGYVVLKDKGIIGSKPVEVVVPLTVLVIKKAAATEDTLKAELKTAKYEDVEALSHVGWYIVTLPEKKKMAIALTDIAALASVENVTDTSTIKVGA